MSKNYFKILFKSTQHFDKKYLKNYKIDILKYSNKKIKKLNYLSNRKKVNLFDFGCGFGAGAVTIINNFLTKSKSINYFGMDKFDLKKTALYLKKYTYLNKNQIHLTKLDYEKKFLLLERKKERDEINIVLLLGTLHHTKSVFTSFDNIVKKFDSKTIFVIWVINKQKPLRSVTDQYFRKFYKKNNNKVINSDIFELAKIFRVLKKTLGNKHIKIDKDIKSINLNKGVHKLQRVLYDYFFKCYSTENSLVVAQSHLKDWFLPKYYHQSDRIELLQFFKKKKLKTLCWNESCNGIFFMLKK